MDIAAVDLRRTAGEESRQGAVASQIRERGADAAYQRAHALVFPSLRPTVDGRPWVGAVPRRVAQLNREQGRARAASTVRNYGPPLRRALLWMRREWDGQSTGRPFSPVEAAGNGGVLVAAYLRHLADHPPGGSAVGAVAAASTAINRWLTERVGQAHGRLDGTSPIGELRRPPLGGYTTVAIFN